VRTNSYRPGNTAGFTLLELLVVIAILALLLSILAPTLARSRELVRRAVCCSGIRSTVAGHQTYASMFRDQYVYGTPAAPVQARYGAWSVWTSGFANSGDSDQDGWFGCGLLFHLGYLGEPGLLYCPSWTHPYYRMGDPVYGFEDVPDPATKKWISRGYHYRATLTLDTGGKARSARGVRDPNGTAILADGFAQAPLVGAGAGMDMHHKEGYNAAYMDGHAQFLIDVDRIVADAMTSNMAFSELEGHWRNFFDRE